MQIYQAIFFTRVGIPLLRFDFEKTKSSIEEALIGGFISAITGFSNQIFQVTSDTFVVDNGNYKLTILLNDDLVFTVISDSPLLHLTQGLRKVVDYFQKFLFVSSSQQYEPERLESLKIKIIYVLFRHPINEEWRAVIDNQHQNFEEVVNKFPRLKEFQADKKIREHSFYKKAFADDIFEMLNYAYYEKVCKFEGMFEPADYIYPLDSLRTLLDPAIAYDSMILRYFPDLNLPTLIFSISELKKISELTKNFGEIVIKGLELLHNLGYIKIVENNFRQIYLLVDFFNTIIEEMYNSFDSNKINPIVKNYIFDTYSGPLLGIFSLKNDQMLISKEMVNIEGKSEEELIELTNQLKKMVVNLFEFLCNKIGKPAKKLLNTIFDHIEINKTDVSLFDLLKDETNGFLK